MTIEKAIESIKCNRPTSGYTILCESLDIAEKAMEKQIPKKPNLYNKFERHCECGAIVKTYQSYCNDCGQALDWSDT